MLFDFFQVLLHRYQQFIQVKKESDQDKEPDNNTGNKPLKCDHSVNQNDCTENREDDEMIAFPIHTYP